MRIQFQTHRCFQSSWAPGRGRRSGLVTLIVLAVVFLLVVLIMANAQVLAHLKAELKRVEARQLKKARVASVAVESRTNSAPRIQP